MFGCRVCADAAWAESASAAWAVVAPMSMDAIMFLFFTGMIPFHLCGDFHR
jgi:hypothetical protein